MAYNDSIAIRNVPPARSLVPISLHNVQVKQNSRNKNNRKKNKSGYNGGVVKNQGDNQQSNAGNAQGGNQQPNAGDNQGGNNNRGNLQQQQGNNQNGAQQSQQGTNTAWNGQRFCIICGSTDHVLMQCTRLAWGSGNGVGGQNPSTPPNTPNAQRERRPLICWLCNTEGTHMAWNCTTYATPAARRQRLETLNKCNSCSRNKHEGACTIRSACSHHSNHRHAGWLCGGPQDPHPNAI